MSRLRFIKTSASAAIGVGLLPSLSGYKTRQNLMTRSFGRLDHEVTSFGLGGQASIQWTPDDVDPVAIILKT